jgi:glycosyltransferase involved in cell wall biosynthesis
MNWPQLSKLAIKNREKKVYDQTIIYNMITGRDIIVVGIQPWDIEIGSNCKNIALEFAKHNRVLYVNQPMDRASRRNEKDTPKIMKREKVLKGVEPDLEQLANNLWILNPRVVLESINFIPFSGVFNYFNRRNAVKFARAAKATADRIHFKNAILFNDSSMFLGVYLKELLKPSLYIYYIRDNLVKNPYWARHGTKLEPKTIQSADVVTTNSLYYEKYASRFNIHSYMVGQGCDVSSFIDDNNSIELNQQVATLKKPVIGYVGFLSSRRLDIDLIRFLAKERPQWSIALVGPQDDAFTQSDLHSFENIHFMGKQPPETLPSFIKGFDVCINPQILNDATIGNYPRKIDEYLAMGKPVVATNTKAMEYFEQHTYLGNSKEDYVNLIEKAIAEDNLQKQKERVAFALLHSWENNVKEIYNACRKAGKL